LFVKTNSSGSGGVFGKKPARESGPEKKKIKDDRLFVKKLGGTRGKDGERDQKEKAGGGGKIGKENQITFSEEGQGDQTSDSRKEERKKGWEVKKEKRVSKIAG